MSDLKPYRVTGQAATEFSSSASKLEKDLQRIVKQNLEATSARDLRGSAPRSVSRY